MHIDWEDMAKSEVETIEASLIGGNKFRAFTKGELKELVAVFRCAHMRNNKVNEKLWTELEREMESRS